MFSFSFFFSKFFKAINLLVMTNSKDFISTS
jgi:hypothetical protein